MHTNFFKVLAPAVMLAPMLCQTVDGQFKSIFKTDNFENNSELPTSIDFTTWAEAKKISHYSVRVVKDFPKASTETQLPVASKLNAMRSKAVFESLWKKDFRLEQLVQIPNILPGGPTLIARWQGTVAFIPWQQTDLRLNDKQSLLNHVSRPAESHLDLVWTGSAFELQCFEFVPSFGRCQLVPLLRHSDSYELETLELHDSLILRPTDHNSLFGLSIEVRKDGTVSIGSPHIDKPLEHPVNIKSPFTAN